MSAVPEDVMALPCPHCGGPAKRLEPMGFWRPEGYTPNGVRYTCADLQCNLDKYGDDKDERALADWNRRAARPSVPPVPDEREEERDRMLLATHVEMMQHIKAGAYYGVLSAREKWLRSQGAMLPAERQRLRETEARR